MYTATKSSPPEAPEVQQPQESLTYWTDSRSAASTMSRPNPSVSNCGLVIVQVQPEQRDQYQRPQYYEQPPPQQPQLTNWSNITLDNRIFLTDTIHQQQPQILHEDPAQVVEVEAVEAAEDEDEGYRTSPGSGNSPQSNNESPPPKNLMGKKVRPLPTSKMAAAAQNGLRKEGDENNLMWLLDFKLDFFNEAEAHGKEKDRISAGMIESSENGHVLIRSCNEDQEALAASLMQHHEATSVSEVIIPSNGVQPQSEEPQLIPEDSSNKEYEKKYRKPPYTYTELITQALKDSTALTVSGIYNWITDRFPYFKAEDERWKNSVRHNLSMNPHFRKGNKTKHGSGHLWVLADIDDDQNDDLTKVGVQQQSHQEVAVGEDEDEAAKAVRSILGHNELESAELREKSTRAPSARAPTHRFEEEANKENSDVKRSTRSKEKSIIQPYPPVSSCSSSFQQLTSAAARGVKRPACEAYPESKLDAPDVFVTTDIHNTACIPPSAKRPTPSSSATSASSVLQMTSSTGPVPFSPMDQIEELDVFCGGYNPPASAGTAASAASTTASNSVSVEVDSLEKALGIEFHDPNVHRQLLAK